MSGALSLALKELELPFVPGSQARKGSGLVFLTQACQGR
jgi:hypothetical protein